jgi:methionyl-tRNA formyltransferase
VLATREPYSPATLPLIEAAPRGILSYHHGNMRSYRGQPPGLWELYDGEQEMGVTVQLLSEALDAGIPVMERTVPIRAHDTPARLRERALHGSADMLHAAVGRLEDPAWEPERIESFGPVYTIPNPRQWLKLNFRLARRRAVSDRTPVK